MTIDEIKERIEEIELEINECSKGMDNASSDFTYWGYVGQVHKLQEELGQLKKDMYYLDLKDALDEHLDSNNFGENLLKQELIKLLDEHKKLSK